MKISIHISQKVMVNAMVALLIIPLFAYLLSYTFINQLGEPGKKPQTIRFNAYSALPVSFQFFYNKPETGQHDFSENQSAIHKLKGGPKPVLVQFVLPEYMKSSKIRIDFGNKSNNTIAISDVYIDEEDKTTKILVQRIAKNFYKSHDLKPPETKNNFLVYKTKGNDPYIIIDNLLPPKQTNDYVPSGIGKFTWIAALITSFLFFILLTVVSRKQTASEYPFHKVLFVSLFVIILLMPLWGLRYDIDKDWKAEKRKPTEKKPFLIQRMFEYPSQFTSYFSDNYGYRKFFIYQYNYILYKLFHQSPLPANIIVGEDDWMYYIPYPELLKIKRFSEQELLTIKMNLEKRKKYFEAQGIKFYVMIAPEKVNIYNEHYPGYDSTRHTVYKLSQLENYLKEDGGFDQLINPTKALLSSKGKDVLFYKQDTHWNDLGAFVGYSCLMNYVKKDFPDLPVLTREDFTIVEKKNLKANIAAMIGIDTTWKTGPHMEFKQKPQSVQISKYKHSEDEYAEVDIRVHQNKGLPRILVFHDSFGTFLMPFISESFSRSVFVFTGYIDESLVAREKPDVVLYELTEGRMNLLLKY